MQANSLGTIFQPEVLKTNYTLIIVYRYYSLDPNLELSVPVSKPWSLHNWPWTPHILLPENLLINPKSFTPKI
jgi:hypothetical protein